MTDHDPSAVEVLARRFATARYGSGVSMSGDHNPNPVDNRHAKEQLLDLTAAGLAVIRVGEVPPWMVSPDGCDPDTLRAWERERAEWAAEREGFLDHIEAIDDHLADINNHRRPRWRTDDGWKVCDLIAMRYESGSVNSSWSTAPWRNSMTLSLTWMPADEWRQWVGVELR